MGLPGLFPPVNTIEDHRRWIRMQGQPNLRATRMFGQQPIDDESGHLTAEDIESVKTELNRRGYGPRDYQESPEPELHIQWFSNPISGWPEAVVRNLGMHIARATYGGSR